MDKADLRRLLAGFGLKIPCDLDLLLFFYRHPTALMASDAIAAFAGYDMAQVAKSLDVLVRLRVLRRTLNPTHIGRLYYFTLDNAGGALPSLIAAGSTPDGR